MSMVVQEAKSHRLCSFSCGVTADNQKYNEVFLQFFFVLADYL